MSQIILENPNTPDYWDRAYREEVEAGVLESKRDLGPIHARVVELMPHEGRVLDVGCGPGLLCRKIRAERPGLEVAGVDFSRFVVENNRERDAELGIDYRCVDIRDSLAEVGGGWDAITLCEVLEHLEDPQRIVPEITRLLRPGGRLVVTCPHDDAVPSREHLWRWGHDELFHLLQPYSGAITFEHFPPPFDRWVLVHFDRAAQPHLDEVPTVSPGRPDLELVGMKEKVQAIRRGSRKKDDRLEKLRTRAERLGERIEKLEARGERQGARIDALKERLAQEAAARRAQTRRVARLKRRLDSGTPVSMEAAAASDLHGTRGDEEHA